MLTAGGQEKLARIQSIQSEISALESELEIILMGEIEEEKVEPERKVLKVRKLTEVEKKPRKEKGSGGSAGARADLLAGMKPGKVAERNGMAIGSVYTLKSAMKKAGEFDGASPSQDHEEDPEEEPSPAQANPPMTQDQFSHVKSLFAQNKMSSEIVRSTGLPLAEVNIAIESSKYGMYIFNRKRK